MIEETFDEKLFGVIMNRQSQTWENLETSRGQNKNRKKRKKTDKSTYGRDGLGNNQLVFPSQPCVATLGTRRSTNPLTRSTDISGWTLTYRTYINRPSHVFSAY